MKKKKDPEQGKFEPVIELASKKKKGGGGGGWVGHLYQQMSWQMNSKLTYIH